MNITTENISHRIDKIEIDEQGVVSGEITLLNTPKGKIAQAIVEGGIPLFISSRASGNVDKNGNVTLESIQTYDLVGSPGFSQAELHLKENQTFESITESICCISEGKDENPSDKPQGQQNENHDMNEETLKQIQEQMEEMKTQIADLQEQNTQLQEQLDAKQDINLQEISEAIQSWVFDEVAPEMQKWVVEKYGASIQNWITEEFTKTVQNWIMEHYNAEVQNWAVKELCPQIQGWVAEEFTQGIQGWLTEHATPELKAEIETKITESLKASKNEKLQSIDAVLGMLESHQQQKPVYGRKNTMVTEGADEPKFIREMPAEKRVQWNMASEGVREAIQQRAVLFNFVNEGAVEKFWESIDFDKITPAKKVNEDLENIKDEWEKNVRAQIRAFHRS